MNIIIGQLPHASPCGVWRKKGIESMCDHPKTRLGHQAAEPYPLPRSLQAESCSHLIWRWLHSSFFTLASSLVQVFPPRPRLFHHPIRARFTAAPVGTRWLDAYHSLLLLSSWALRVRTALAVVLVDANGLILVSSPHRAGKLADYLP